MSSAEINDVRINTNPPKPKIRWIGVDPDQVAVMRQYFAFGNDTEALEFLRKGDQRILLPVHDMTYGEYWLQRVEEGTPANRRTAPTSHRQMRRQSRSTWPTPTS